MDLQRQVVCLSEVVDEKELAILLLSENVPPGGRPALAPNRGVLYIQTRSPEFHTLALAVPHPNLGAEWTTITS